MFVLTQKTEKGFATGNNALSIVETRQVSIFYCSIMGAKTLTGRYPIHPVFVASVARARRGLLNISQQ